MATAPTHPSTRDFRELMVDFLAYLDLERGLSRNTLGAYRSDLDQYGAYLERTGIAPLAVTHTQLADFIGQLTAGEGEKAAAPATVQRKVACLRSFHRHLRREGILERDPTADLRAPRSTQRRSRFGRSNCGSGNDTVSPSSPSAAAHITSNSSASAFIRPRYATTSVSSAGTSTG